MNTATSLLVQFTRRNGPQSTTALTTIALRPLKWQFVAANYNGANGIAKFFAKGRFVERRYIGRIRLATNYPERMGARIGDGRFFKGRISCMQVYNGALSGSQLISKKRSFSSMVCISFSQFNSRRAK